MALLRAYRALGGGVCGGPGGSRIFKIFDFSKILKIFGTSVPGPNRAFIGLIWAPGFKNLEGRDFFISLRVN